MRALGVDPGTLATGYGIVDMKGNRLTHVGHGVIKTSPGAPLAARLVQIHQELVEVIAKYKPDEAGVENVFHAKNAQSALKLGHARGVILLAIELAGIPMEEYMPLQVKSAVVGYGCVTGCALSCKGRDTPFDKLTILSSIEGLCRDRGGKAYVLLALLYVRGGSIRSCSC